MNGRVRWLTTGLLVFLLTAALSLPVDAIVPRGRWVTDHGTAAVSATSWDTVASITPDTGAEILIRTAAVGYHSTNFKDTMAIRVLLNGSNKRQSSSETGEPEPRLENLYLKPDKTTQHTITIQAFNGGNSQQTMGGHIAAIDVPPR